MITLGPFSAKHVQDAADLFAEWYKKQRERIAYLPVKYERAETIVPLLQEMVDSQPGIAAVSNGKLVGYLTGYANIPNFKGVSPGVYVPEWGHAVPEMPGRERIMQSMYSAIAREWVSQGCSTHAIGFFPSDTALRDLLFWNGFGLLVIDAIRPIEWNNKHNPTEADAGIVIRHATEDDLEGLLNLDNKLRTYLSSSPTFLYHDSDDEQETAAHFLGTGVVSVVAEQDDRIVACIRATNQKQDSCTIVQDESVIGINFGFTDPAIRGTGIGTRILKKVLEWGQSQEKVACAVDFESANVLGRSFWLRHFEAVCFSAIRLADPRVACNKQNP